MQVTNRKPVCKQCNKPAALYDIMNIDPYCMTCTLDNIRVIRESDTLKNDAIEHAMSTAHTVNDTKAHTVNKETGVKND